MDEKGKANLNSEDLRLYIDSCCSEIMRIKEIKPDLHRQWVEHLHIFKLILLWKLFFLDSYNLWRYVFVRLSVTNSWHLMWRNWGRVWMSDELKTHFPIIQIWAIQWRKSWTWDGTSPTLDPSQAWLPSTEEGHKTMAIDRCVIKEFDVNDVKLNILGFQGEDPKTDFRGMGMLGLSNLV